MTYITEKNYFLNIINTLENGIITISDDYTVNFLNKKAYLLLDVDFTVIDKNIEKLLQEVIPYLDSLKISNKENYLNVHISFNTSQLLFNIHKLQSSEGTYIFILDFKLSDSKANLETSQKLNYTFKDIIGNSPSLKELISSAKKISKSPSTVLITGESGCGKELLAQAIHSDSLRNSKPFIAINCGAIPPNLIESELFGYEEGTFTGARRGGSPGKFELANGGTIFLDEIGEMPMDMQVNLLRVLQEGVITRLGGKIPLKLDIRVIAATNKNLREEIKLGKFRQDLFYRLNVIPLHIPALKDRFGDIPILLDYFLKVKSSKLSKPIPNISNALFKKIISYCWPGNIRELENFVENLVNLNGISNYDMNFDECICLKYDNLGNKISSVSSTTLNSSIDAFIPQSLLELEIRTIKETIDYYNGNMTKVAKTLGISRNALYNKVKRYGLK